VQAEDLLLHFNIILSEKRSKEAKEIKQAHDGLACALGKERIL
jgi:hypothetical protein